MAAYNRRFEGDFAASIHDHPAWPVVISEGDSWFSYPFERNVVDWLDDPKDTGDPARQTKWSLLRLEGSGDEILSMLSGGQRADLREYFEKYDVQALLFSGGGNDIVGPDLLALLKPFVAGMQPRDCLRADRLARRLRQIEDCYHELIDLCADAGKGTRIFAHGYDYAKPSRVGVKLLGVLSIGPWMLPYMEERGIRDRPTQEGIVHALIDDFNQVLAGLAAPAFTYLDVRTRVGNDWKNEIHANRKGTKRVAGTFAAALRQAFPGKLSFAGL